MHACALNNSCVCMHFWKAWSTATCVKGPWAFSVAHSDSLVTSEYDGMHLQAAAQLGPDAAWQLLLKVQQLSQAQQGARAVGNAGGVMGAHRDPLLTEGPLFLKLAKERWVVALAAQTRSWPCPEEAGVVLRVECVAGREGGEAWHY